MPIRLEVGEVFATQKVYQLYQERSDYIPKYVRADSCDRYEVRYELCLPVGRESLHFVL